jgi:hypothetical protein
LSAKFCAATVFFFTGHALAQAPAPAAPPSAATPPAPPPAAAAPAPGPAPAAATPPAVAPEPPPAAPTTAAPVEPTTTADAVAPAPSVEPSAGPELAEPALPEKLSVGKSGGHFRPGLLLQFWTLFSREAGEDSLTFRMRRAELKVQGDIVPELVTYSLMIDPAKMLEFRSTEVPVEGQEPEPTAPGSVTVQQPASSAPYTVLQDYFITLQSEYVDFSMGQFKIPVSLEGVTSSSKIVLPERSLASRAYGDRREIGLRFEKKIGDYFGYHAGIYHGSGQNRLDNDVDKDAALRLEAYPLEGITLAAVGYATVGDRDDSSRDRLEFDARYDANSILVQGEYIHGWDAAGGGATEGHAWYAMAGYTFLDSIQPVFRFGQVDLNLDTEDDSVMQFEGGVNYLFRKHEAKLGLVASFLHPETGPKHTDLLLAAQVGF